MGLVRGFLLHISSVVWLLIDTVNETSDHVFRGRLPFRVSQFFAQTQRAGVESVPLVALVSFFLGLTMALLSGYILRSFGQQGLIPDLVAIGFTRELGPLITGIMLAARIGAAYTAELGSMTVNDEVEAIEAMGIGARRLLIGPRLLAVASLTPALAVVSNLAAVLGGALISLWVFGISLQQFFVSAIDSLFLRDIVGGVLKSILFGGIIGIVACYKGLAVRGGAEGVGTSTTSSVVTAITTVIASDTVFNIVQTSIFEA